MLMQVGSEFGETFPYYDAFPNLEKAIRLENFCMLGLMAFSIYAGLRLWLIEPNAVKTARIYLLTLLIYRLVLLFFKRQCPYALKHRLKHSYCLDGKNLKKCKSALFVLGSQMSL